MTAVTPAELLDLAARARAARNLLRAVVRTPTNGPIRVRLRSPVRTHDRMGSGEWAGDPLRLLILRELANRNLLVVKTFHAFSEAHGQVALDTSFGVLGVPEVGPFAVKLAFLLAAAIAWERQPVGVSYLRGRPPQSVDRPSRLPALADELVEATARPESVEAAALLDRLRGDLGRPRANANVFLITHPGHPVERLEPVLRELSARTRGAAVFLPVAESEFDDTTEIADPDTGARVVLAGGAGAALTAHLDALVALGRSTGVPVWPLVVREHNTDLDTLLPQLARLL